MMDEATQMNLGNDLLSDGGTTVQGTLTGKCPDESFQPRHRPPGRSNQWPTLLLEVGYTESPPHLTVDRQIVALELRGRGKNRGHHRHQSESTRYRTSGLAECCCSEATNHRSESQPKLDHAYTHSDNDIRSPGSIHRGERGTVKITFQRYLSQGPESARRRGFRVWTPGAPEYRRCCVDSARV